MLPGTCYECLNNDCNENVSPNVTVAFDFGQTCPAVIQKHPATQLPMPSHVFSAPIRPAQHVQGEKTNKGFLLHLLPLGTAPTITTLSQEFWQAAWQPTPPWRPAGSRSMRAAWQRCKPCSIHSNASVFPRCVSTTIRLGLEYVINPQERRSPGWRRKGLRLGLEYVFFNPQERRSPGWRRKGPSRRSVSDQGNFLL